MISYYTGSEFMTDDEKVMYKLLQKRIDLYEKQLPFFRKKLWLLQKAYLLKTNQQPPAFFHVQQSKTHDGVFIDISHVVTEDFYRKIMKYNNSSNKHVIETKIAIICTRYEKSK